MKYYTKNGSIVAHVRANLYKVLRGGHKCYRGRGGYSKEVNNEYVVTDTLVYDTSCYFDLSKKEYDKYHGLDIVGPVLNFYEVACMMKSVSDDDITYCHGGDCPQKEDCVRWVKNYKGNSPYLSMTGMLRKDGKCGHYIRRVQRTTN